MVDIFFLFGSYFQEDFEPRPRYCLIVVSIMITNSNYINFDYFSYLKCVNIKKSNLLDTYFWWTYLFFLQTNTDRNRNPADFPKEIQGVSRAAEENRWWNWCKVNTARRWLESWGRGLLQYQGFSQYPSYTREVFKWLEKLLAK